MSRLPQMRQRLILEMQKNAMYKVDVKDFGSGTLDGLKDNLDILVESGVGTVYLTSFFKTQGPVDANNFNSELGTAEDWESLVTGLKERDLKVLINWPTTYMKDKKDDDEMMWIEKESMDLSLKKTTINKKKSKT